MRYSPFSEKPYKRAQRIFEKELENKGQRGLALELLQELGRKAQFAVPVLKKILQTAKRSEHEKAIQKVLGQFSK